MNDSSEELLNQVVGHFQATDVPPCPPSWDSNDRTPRLSRAPVTPRVDAVGETNRVAPVAVVLALSILAAVVTVSMFVLDRHSDGKPNIAASDLIWRSDLTGASDAELVTELPVLPGLIRRSTVQSVSFEVTEPKCRIRQELARMNMELQELANRASLLKVRDQVGALDQALSKLFAIVE
jgi:hypothetical protein